MGLGIYVDHNVRREIVEGLRARSIDCLTCAEDGTNRLDDEPDMVRASALNRVTLTMDADLIQIASRWAAEGKTFRSVIYAHELSVSIGRVVADVELLIKCSADEELLDTVIWLPIQLVDDSRSARNGVLRIQSSDGLALIACHISAYFSRT